MSEGEDEIPQDADTDAAAAEEPGENPAPAHAGKKHVVVLGGGFGGLEFCKRLEDPERFHLTLIDRQNHHCFQPLLYQVASGGLAAPEIAQPLRSILTKREDLDVLMDEVVGIYPDEKMIATRTREIRFDYLVIALGVKTGYFGNDKWAKFAPGLKSLDDAMEIRRRILLAFEKAEAAENEDEIRKLLSIVVVGGGPTGVELAGSFAELAKRVVSRDFRKIDTTKADVVLIEAGPRLLPMFSEKLSEYTKLKLTKMGIRVLTDHAVKDLGDDFVVAGNTRIEAANIIWAAGVEAPPMIHNMGAELDRGRLVVEPDLSLKNHENVFAIGDIASCCDSNEVKVPGLCPAAIQMGKHVARQLLEDERKPFAYKDKGSMATIGRSAAVAKWKLGSWTGFKAWILWLFVHLLFLVGFRNKIAVLWQWFYSYITYKRGARIITGMPEPPKTE